MRRLIAAAAFFLVLAAPAGAWAADATPPVPSTPAAPALGGSWVIGAIETSGATLQITGKLAITSELTTSVGCNTMSAPVVGFDGTHLSIGDIATTEIGCPPEQAQAEQMLAAILGAGPLTFDGRSLTSRTGTIELVGNQPAEPVATAPVEPGNPGVDPATCAQILGPEWNLGTPASVPGSTGEDSGSSGGNTTTVEASGPAAVASDLPGTIVVEAPSPVVVSTADPGTGVVTPPLPQPLPVEVASPDATAATIVAPNPSGSPSLEQACRDLLTRTRVDTQAIPPAGAVPGAQMSSESADSASSSPNVAVIAALVLVALVALVAVAILGRRAWSRPPGTPPSPADRSQ